MNAWWESLVERERWLIIVAVLVGGGGGLYLLGWEPFYKHLVSLRQSVAEERIQMAWMVQAQGEARALLGAASTDRKRSGESLLAMVDRSARAAGMGAGLKRVEPEGKDKVRVWMDDIAFDGLIPWLADLNKTQGVTPESLVVDRQSTTGRVNVRLVLAGVGE